VTLQPVDILGVDAAILFFDILIAVGQWATALEFHDKKGPVLGDPVRTKAGVTAGHPDTEDSMPFVLGHDQDTRRETEVRYRIFRRSVDACRTYIIEGGSSKNFLHTKKMNVSDPGLFNALLRSLPQRHRISLCSD